MLIRILFTTLWFVPITCMTVILFCVAAVIAAAGRMSDTEAQHIGSVILQPALLTATLVTILAARRGWLPGARKARA